MTKTGEDQVKKNSRDIEDLSKSVQELKQIQGEQFSFMKDQLAAVLSSLNNKSNHVDDDEATVSDSSILEPYPHIPRPAVGIKRPKMEMPTFKGLEPRAWLRKCERYFQFHSVKEEDKVALAEMHLEGQAEIWYSSWRVNRRITNRKTSADDQSIVLLLIVLESPGSQFSPPFSSITETEC